MFFNLYLLSIFADMSAIQILFPFLAKVHFQKIVVVLAILGIFFQSTYFQHAKKGLFSKQGYILLFLVLCMLMSIPLSMWPGGSFRFITETFWKTLVLVVLTLAYTKSDDSLNKVIWAYILATGFMAIITIAAAGSGRMEINEDYDPNDTALQFLMALPFAFWWFKGAYGFRRMILAAICMIFLVGLIWTQSRGGFIGLVAVITVSMVQVKKFERKGFMKITFLVSVILMTLLYFGGDQYIDRISTMLNPSDDYNVSSVGGRIQLWQRGIEMMLNNPLLGVGVAQFTTGDGLLYDDIGSKWQTAHNSFIQIGAELGLPGLAAFVFLIWSSIRGIAKTVASHRSSEGDRSILIVPNALIGSWVSFVVCGSFLSSAYTTSFFFLLSLSIAFLTLENLKAVSVATGKLIRTV